MLAFPALSSAQVNPSYEIVPVEISSIRAQRDNSWFYVHKVQPKQTLYSICRAYEVTQQEVYEANRAALETGLKAGMDLYIPFHGDIEAENAAQPQAQAENAVEQQTQPQPDQQNGDGYTTHRVKWYETLYSIARKYEISPEAIIRANHLTRVDLRTGQILRIPTSNYQDAVERQVNGDYAEEVDQNEITVVEEIQPAEEEPAQPYDDIFFNEPFSGKARIALLLPFNSKSSSPSSNYLDFYSGVLLALERIKAQGVSADLKVIDITEYANNIGALASDQFLGDRDFVIGPVMSADISKIVDYCNMHGIPLISPMDQQAERLVSDNPSLIQAPVSADNQIAKLIESMDFTSTAK